jgi:hypothetical protein
MLRFINFLVKVACSDNPLGDEGAAALAEGLLHVPGLLCLALG